MFPGDANDHRIGDATPEEFSNALVDKTKEESLQPLELSDAPPRVDADFNDKLIDDTRSASNNVEQRTEDSLLEEEFSLLRIQNGRSNLLRLPPEALVEIAVAYRAEILGCCAGYDCTSHDEGWTEHARARLLEILKLSQIFSYLRGIYLDTPRLWSYIELSWSPTIIQLFTERSRSRPLSLILMARDSDTYLRRSANEFDSMVDFNVSFLTINMQRIQNLQISIFTRGIDVLKLWEGLKNMPAPQLKKFTFDVALNLPSRVLPLQDLFSNCAPKLSKLKVCLASCREFQPTSFTALVSLALTIRGNGALSNIWDVLSQTPLLKRLELSGDRVRRQTKENPPVHRVLTVTLSSCRAVRLHFQPEEIAYLFSVLEFPALIDLMVTSEAYEADDVTIVSIFSPNHFPPILKSMVSSTVELNLEIHDNMTGFMVPLRPVSHDPDECPHPFTVIRERSYVRTEECKLVFLYCVFQELKIKPETLYLDGWNPDDEYTSFEEDEGETTPDTDNMDIQEKKPKRVATFTRSIWNAILSGCPSVTTMDLHRTLPLWPFIEALDQPTINCPSLTQLNISIHPDDFDLQSFDRMLENRKSRDAEIEEVEVDISKLDY
ncbi:hypothetical protein SISSUDRAFT_785281 [Sistotremastrum suecicum HHB10207 ss-3]|uniref:F-box domain-containing protein n=1 Tax=Sistotremastrum suecicum HHB10207 ss-3 TaxID=1314776 RepID=A0A166D372_9AGAM|nr:hypothetical protein SISSUDRAFT_785281 [Sistotremastrum suecicum HHB10207 ss-3]